MTQDFALSSQDLMSNSPDFTRPRYFAVLPRLVEAGVFQVSAK